MLTVKAAASRLGVKAALVYRLVARREIAHSRVGLGRGVIRIAEADVEEYLARRRKGAGTYGPLVVEVRAKHPAVPALKHLRLD